MDYTQDHGLVAMVFRNIFSGHAMGPKEAAIAKRHIHADMLARHYKLNILPSGSAGLTFELYSGNGPYLMSFNSRDAAVKSMDAAKANNEPAFPHYEGILKVMDAMNGVALNPFIHKRIKAYYKEIEDTRSDRQNRMLMPDLSVNK